MWRMARMDGGGCACGFCGAAVTAQIDPSVHLNAPQPLSTAVPLRANSQDFALLWQHTIDLETRKQAPTDKSRQTN
jgi:hypothetical protein